MSAIGLIVHRDRREALAEASDLTRWLAAQGHSVHMTAAEAQAAGCAQSVAEISDSARDLDLVVTLGGDGSILRAVELTGESGIPILGVNFGHMGYLTEVRPQDARRALERVLAGDHSIEERMLLGVSLDLVDAERSDDAATRLVALNETVVERRAASYAMRLGVSINDEHFTTYAADGLIVATPTGSTAYALSARGPVIDPTHRAILLTPVSPHMLFDRSMVVDADTTLRLEVLGDRGAVLSIDGRRQAELREHDAVICSASAHPVRLVTFGACRFHQVLKSKFGLNDR